jgi:hypothetical protein
VVVVVSPASGGKTETVIVLLGYFVKIEERCHELHQNKHQKELMMNMDILTVYYYDFPLRVQAP